MASDVLPDGGFDGGISGWHLVGRGSTSHVTDEGANAPGSMRVTGGLAGNRTQGIAGFCLDSLSPGQNLQFAFKVKVEAGSPAFCRLALFESNRSDCRWLSLGAQSRRTFFYSGWLQSPAAHLLMAGSTLSVEVRLHCANAAGDTGPLEVLFDDVTLIETSGSAFADGFETGTTERWSDTNP